MVKTAIIYVRVSDPSQIDNFSLDSQEASCRKKAIELGFDEVKLFREEGISAKTIDDRPQLQEALVYCRNKKNNITGFIVYSYSRLSRQTVDFETIKAFFKKSGISLISIVEPYGDSPENNLISTVISSINQFDNEIKARVVRANMKARFLQGYPLGKARLGYKIGVVDGKSCPVPDEPMFTTLQTVWHRVKNEHLSLQEVQRELKKITGKEFPRQTISDVFLNKFYMGTIQSKQYGEVQGKHQAMIDENTYYLVREIITGKKPHEQARHHMREEFPLRGTLICEFCGQRLSAAWSKGWSKMYPYYACSSRGKHKIISINTEDTQKRYVDLLASLSPKPKFMKLLSELVVEQYEAKIKQQSTIPTAIPEEIARLTAMRKELARKNLAGIYSDQDYIELRDDIDKQIASMYGQVDQKTIETVDIDKVMNSITDYFSSLDSAWLKADLAGKHKISSSMFPRGVICTKNSLRTVEIARIYEQTKKFSEEIRFSTPSRIRTGDLVAENHPS